MVFWIGILVAAAFARQAAKIGFLGTWIMLFHLMVSVYLAVFLQPSIADLMPAADEKTYVDAIVMVPTAVASFLILQGLSYSLFKREFTPPFAKTTNSIAAGSLGFMGGLLIWCFATVVACTTPLCRNYAARKLGLNDTPEGFSVSYVCLCADLIHSVVGGPDSTYTAKTALAGLLKHDPPAEQPQ